MIVYIITVVQLFALLKVLNLIIVMYLGSNDKFKLSFTRDIFWQSCLMTEKYSVMKLFISLNDLN